MEDDCSVLPLDEAGDAINFSQCTDNSVTVIKNATDYTGAASNGYCISRDLIYQEESETYIEKHEFSYKPSVYEFSATILEDIIIFGEEYHHNSFCTTLLQAKCDKLDGDRTQIAIYNSWFHQEK